VSDLFERPADLPRVACSHCGGAHRAEAVPIDIGEFFPKYIAGTITCPALVLA
jgi:hypothetical protein